MIDIYNNIVYIVNILQDKFFQAPISGIYDAVYPYFVPYKAEADIYPLKY